MGAADPSWVLQIALAVLGGGGLVSIVTAFMNRKKISADARKANADATKVFTESAVSLIAPFQDQVARLSKDLTNSEERASILANKLEEATSRIDELKIEMDKMYQQIEYYQQKFGPPTPTGHIYPISGRKRF